MTRLLVLHELLKVQIRSVDVDSIMQMLDGYFESLSSRGERLPSHKGKESPHFRAISAASGIDFKYLIKEPYRQRVILAVQEVGLIPQEGTQASRREIGFNQNRAILSNYLNWLEDNALKLPEDPGHRGEVFFAQVEIESGLSPMALKLKGTEGGQAYNVLLRQMIKKAAACLGMEVRVLPHNPGEQRTMLSYEQLLVKGTEERAGELIDRSSAQQQLYNTRSALNRFLNTLHIEETAVVGNELISGFEASLEKVTSKIDNASSRKKFQTEIYWWRDFYQRLLKGSSIPEDLHDALVFLIDRSGLSLSVLAKLIDINISSLKEWYRGTETPSRLSLSPMYRMELLFKLPAGSLVMKISNYFGNKRFRISEMPAFLQQTPRIFHRISKHLPDDFCSLPNETQAHVVQSICTSIVRGDDAYTIKLMTLMNLPYRLKEWPVELHEEFEAYADFKTRERAPLGMKRNSQWKRPASKKKCENEFAYFFGSLRLSVDAEDESLRGLGLPGGHLALALIACPLIIDWYIRFRCERRTQYTEHAINLLNNFKSMLRPKTGWLRQKPELAARLRSVSDGETQLISQELISRAQVDWDGVCDAAIEYYDQLILDIEPLVSVARDSFSRIEGIINMAQPMDAMELLIQRIKDAMPNPSTQPVGYHTAVRTCALVLLITVTGLRRNTIVQLDYTGDDRGHLIPRAGGYVLCIPRSFFKEENSPFFGPKRAPSDYFMELPDAFGLNEMLTKYLRVSRPWLMDRYFKNSMEQPLFVASVGSASTRAGTGSPRLSPEQVQDIYSRETEKHLVENKWRGTGIANVRRHGPHSIRHIRGTTAVRATGSLQDAADANHNSLSTAREYYARFLPEDKNRNVNDILFKGKGKKKKSDEE